MRVTRRALIAAVLSVAALAPATAALAQEVPVQRFYIVPKTGDGTFPNPFRPKYMRELRAIGPVVPYSAMDYGLENTFLVAATVTALQHASISGNVDVIALPPDLDSNVGLSAVATSKTRLEGLFVPGDGVSTGATWRQVIGTIGRIFLLMQRYHGMFGEKFFVAGGDLDLRLNQLSGNRAQLTAAAQDLASSSGQRLDFSGIRQTTTVRQALSIIAAQLPPFSFGGETF